MRINTDNNTVDMEARDINYILPAYVRSYLFYNKNIMPQKIIFPMFPSIKVDNTVIPIEYVSPTDPRAVELAKDASNIPEVTPEQEALLDAKDEEIKKLKVKVAELETPAAKEPLTPTPEDLLRQVQEEALPGEGEDKPPAESPAKTAFAGLEPVPEEETTEGLTEEEQTYEAARADQPGPEALKVDPDPAHQPPPGRKPGQPPGGDIGPGQGLSDMHARDRKDQAQTTRDLLEEPEIKEEEQVPFEKVIKRDDKGRPIIEEPKAES